MIDIAKLVHHCLRSHLAGRQVIFSSDVYRAHVTKQVWQAMTRWSYLYFLIPAKITWAMQPCDTHDVLAVLKRHLVEAMQMAAVSSNAGEVPLRSVVEIVV